MRKWAYLSVLILIQFVGQAQDDAPREKGAKISGQVMDSLNHTAIEYATISIYRADNQKAVNGTTSDGKGQFTLSGLQPGIYSLVIESVGYKSRRFEKLSISKNSSLDLKEIRLQTSQKTLQAVTVTAPQGLIENKIDKIVFNAEKDLTSQGGVATDILKKLPQVSVDVDGNVELAGSTSIRFLINGKPSSAFGSSIADVLQSIPASQIKTIEIITNPGAKYDAEGLGGIINIILKSSKANGINGNISMTAGTRIENGSFNFNARHGNFGVNAYLSGNLRVLAGTPYESERISADTFAKNTVVLTQNGESRIQRHGYQTGIGFDWVYHKKNSLTGSVSYSNFGTSGNGSLNQDQTITESGGSGNVISQVSTVNPSSSEFQFHTFDASLGYKRTFDKEDQELEISANSSFGNNHISSSSYQLWQPQDSLFFGTMSENPGKEYETQVMIDYTQPIKKDIRLGFGAKGSFTNITSNSTINSYQPYSQEYVYDSTLSNSLTYDQKVYAAYAEASFPVSTWFNVKLGGRYERTEIASYFSNAQQQASIPGYNTFVPSIFFSRKLGENQTLRLNYSKRINRPDYRDLNPFVNTTDPKNVTSGNPYLRPEIRHRVELSYNREFGQAGSVTVSAFYWSSNDDIQPYIVYYPQKQVGDSIYTNISVSTASNIGLEKNFGLSLFGDVHPTTALGIRANIFMFGRNTINIIDPGYNSSSFNYRFNLNLSYQFKNNFAAEFFGNFNSPRNELQGRYPSFTSYSLAFRKQIWNKKGSIALTATNPFNEYVDQRSSLHGPNFTQTSLRQVPFRSIGINFTWKFGKLQFKKEKEENAPDAAAPEN